MGPPGPRPDAPRLPSKERRRRRDTSPHQKHRHSKRDDQVGRHDEAKQRARRKQSRSRSRGRREHGGERRHHKSKKSEGTSQDATPVAQVPPSDWRGPVALDPRGAPPSDWRGPSAGSVPPPQDWHGPPGHVFYPPPDNRFPPPRDDPRWPPPRPMNYPPPMHGPGPVPQRPGLPPSGQWGGHMPPPVQRPPFDPRLPQHAPFDPRLQQHVSTQGGPSMGPPSHWAGGPPQGERPSQSFAGSFQQPHAITNQETFESSSPAVPSNDAPASAATSNTGIRMCSAESEVNGLGGVNTLGARGHGIDNGEEQTPAPRTASDRLRGIRLVHSSLSESFVERLSSLGVAVDGSDGRQPSAPFKPTFAVGADMSPTALAAAQSKCAKLGLAGGDGKRARLPPPKQGPPKLPACIIEPAHDGLWEQFLARCGTALSVEAPQPMACELRKSLGGGHVIVPMASTR